MSKYVIDDSTLSSIADAIREKTGGTDPIAVADMATQIGSITGGGSSGEVVLEKQSVQVEFAQTLFLDNIYAPNPIAVGETYKVFWDGTEYECTAVSIAGTSFETYGSVAMGNTVLLNGTDNKVPFVILYDARDSSFMVVSVYATAPATHTLAINKGDVVLYVTFMSEDGVTELYKKPVFYGNTCVSPVVPSKESTNTEVFTPSGWSLTAGGSADNSVLLNVTEDRTVYAAYTASTRYYTVRFFDGDTLLHTVYAEYGSTAEYTPEGTGFGGWQPSNANITQDTDCYAQWLETISFANASWEEINQVCESGEAAKNFAVGDTKTFTHNNRTFTARIIGIEYDDKSDGSGKAGITVALRPCHTKVAYGTPINQTYTFWTLLGGNSNETSCNLRKFLRNDFFTTYLPAEVTSLIKTVKKKTYNAKDSKVDETDETIFIPSREEFAGYTHAGGAYVTEATIYPGFVDPSGIEQYNTTGSLETYQWVRSSEYNGYAIYVSGGQTGYISRSNSQSYAYTPCFCI